MVAPGARAKIFFESAGVARSACGRIDRKPASAHAVEAKDSDSENDLGGLGAAGAPSKRAPEEEARPEEASGEDSLGATPHASAAKRARPRGSGVGDIARTSVKRTPCARTETKAQRQSHRATEVEELLEKPASRLLEERFRDFGMEDDIKPLSDGAGGLLWGAVKATRAASARVSDQQVRELRKRFAPPGLAEHDLRISFPEDMSEGSRRDEIA